MTRPWPIGFVQMNSHKETESSETSEMFIRWKKGSYELTHTGGLREFRSRCGLKDLFQTFLPGFLWPIILLCLVLSLYLVYLRSSPVCAYLLAKMESSKEAYG